MVIPERPRHKEPVMRRRITIAAIAIAALLGAAGAVAATAGPASASTSVYYHT